MTSLVAIDPGLKGGIARLCHDGSVEAIAMPLAGKNIDLQFVASLIGTNPPDWLILEKVGSMPKQGIASTFKFGMGYGAIQGIAAALKIPLELVTPQRWKSKVLHGTKKDKDAAIQFCRRAFPTVDLIPPRCRTPHDGIADALCLLEYGRRELLVNQEAA